MCECTEQLNQVMDKLGVMQAVLDGLVSRLEQVDIRTTSTNDDVADVHEFVVEMAKVMEQFKTMFSEDNIMGMLGGFMGGGMPEIKG